MDRKPLTKDADKLLAQLYKSYLEKRKSGASREDAMSLGGIDEIIATATKTNTSDIEALCRELIEADYIEAAIYDDAIYCANMKTDTIIYLENRFKSGLKDVLSFIAQFIP